MVEAGKIEKICPEMTIPVIKAIFPRIKVEIVTVLCSGPKCAKYHTCIPIETLLKPK